MAFRELRERLKGERKKGRVQLILDDHTYIGDFGKQAEAVLKHRPDVVLHEILNTGGQPSEEMERIAALLDKYEEHVRELRKKGYVLSRYRLPDNVHEYENPKNIDRALQAIKIMERQLIQEKEQLQKMAKRNKWAVEKLKEKDDLHRRVLEIKEVITLLKNYDTTGLVKAANILRVARKQGAEFKGLEPAEAASKHVVALAKGDARGLLQAISERNRAMAEEIIRHLEGGKRVTAVMGALHGAEVYRILKERGYDVDVKFFEDGVDWREALENQARAGAYSEEIRRRAIEALLEALRMQGKR